MEGEGSDEFTICVGFKTRHTFFNTISTLNMGLP